MTVTKPNKNTKTLRHYISKFSLIVELTLPFASSLNMIREVKIMSPNFKWITSLGFTSLNILILIVRCVISLNFKQLQQKV